MRTNEKASRDVSRHDIQLHIFRVAGIQNQN